MMYDGPTAPDLYAMSRNPPALRLDADVSVAAGRCRLQVLPGVFVECDESYPLDRCWCGLDRCHGDPGGLVGRESVHAGGDRGEGDGPGAEFIGELQAASVAG